MINKLFAVLITAITLAPWAFFLTGCATVQTASTSQTQTLINDAWSAANELQKSNNGQLITPAAQTAVLNLTHNSGDAAYASIAAALINQVAGAVIASQAAKVNAVPSVNAVLAPANVAATADSVASGSAAPTP